MPSYEYIWADTDRNRITIVEEHNPQRDIFQNILEDISLLREAMSHAQTSRMETDGSSLTISRNTDRMHTANAATVREHEVLMNLSAWLIEAQAFVIVKPTTDFRKEQQMGKVICIANQKGGVGKTTTCVNLGIALAMAGKRVCLIDSDPQGSLTESLGYRNPGT